MHLRRSIISICIISILQGFPAYAESGLVVYSARKEEMIKPLLDRYSAKTGIAIKLLNDDSAKLIARLESEGEHSPADLLMTVDVMNAMIASEKKLTKPIKSDILTQTIPAEYRDPSNEWFGLGKRARVIFYNKEQVLPEALSTYEALADAKWKGKILSRSSSNVYTQSLIAAMIAAHGEAEAQNWATKFTANIMGTPKSSDIDIIKAVGAGEAPLGVGNSYYYARLLNSTVPGEKELAEKVGIFFPNQNAAKGEMQGTHVNISTGAVVATSKHEAEAVKLLEYLIGEEAQRFYADGNQEYPMNAKVQPSATLQSFGTFKADTVPMIGLARHAKAAIIAADKAGWQ